MFIFFVEYVVKWGVASHSMYHEPPSKETCGEKCLNDHGYSRQSLKWVKKLVREFFPLK